MKKALFLIALTALVSTSINASVVKGYDRENSCDLYRVVQADTNGKIKKRSDEVIIFTKEVYGLSFQDMEINFDNREVKVQPVMNVILGFNRPLTAGKTIISQDNPDFEFLINQLNRKISVFEKLCINDGKVVYAKFFEEKTQQQKAKIK